jgi:hypothetical protein
MCLSAEARPESLLVEYQVAYAGVLHYDSFKWSAGSMLIAGVFLFWGVLFASESAQELFAPASCLVALVMTVWILYASHYRQLYLLKLHRIREIEEALGMHANRRFVYGTDDTGPRYATHGLSGHTLDLCLYSLVSLGGAVLSMFREGLEWWQLLPVIVTLFGLVTYLRQEQRTAATLGALASLTTTPSAPNGSPVD